MVSEFKVDGPFTQVDAALAASALALFRFASLSAFRVNMCLFVNVRLVRNNSAIFMNRESFNDRNVVHTPSIDPPLFALLILLPLSPSPHPHLTHSVSWMFAPTL